MTKRSILEGSCSSTSADLVTLANPNKMRKRVNFGKSFSSEYSKMVYDFLREEELLRHGEMQDCLTAVTDLNINDRVDARMRRVLINWLVEVADGYRLNASTIFLMIYLVDQTLVRTPVSKHQFQLVGCACLLIAAKFEEIKYPSLQNLVHLSDNCFDRDALAIMERQILSLLEFQVRGPTTHGLAVPLFNIEGMSQKEVFLTEYLLELALHELPLSMQRASLVAAAAVHLSLQTLRFTEEHLWSAALQRLTGYTEEDLYAYICMLSNIHFLALESGVNSASIGRYDRIDRLRVARLPAVLQSSLRFDDPALQARVRNKDMASSPTSVAEPREQSNSVGDHPEQVPS